MKDKKIYGMMLGVAVGDALGQPYENQPALGYPIKEYVKTGGQTTDDWQLTEAVAVALVKGGGFVMSEMVESHVKAYKTTTRGWGGAHRDACDALSKGVSPDKTGTLLLNPAKPYRGRGNGMCMKISPLAAYHYVMHSTVVKRLSNINQLTKMTHWTVIGLSSAMGMEEALIYCLKQTPQTFDVKDFLDHVFNAILRAEVATGNTVCGLGHKMSERIAHLADNWQSMTPEDVSETYKGGGYAYESFPFALAFFCMGKHDLNCVYDCAGSGGDTDTNASMVAALAGALHGDAVFPLDLLDKLVQYSHIEMVSGQFAEWCEHKNIDHEWADKK